MSDDHIDQPTMQEALAELNAWIAENQPEITQATVEALDTLTVIVDSQLDPEAPTFYKEFEQAITNTASGVMAEHFKEAFKEQFANLTDSLREALAVAVEEIVRADPGTFAALLRAWMLANRKP